MFSESSHNHHHHNTPRPEAAGQFGPFRARSGFDGAPFGGRGRGFGGGHGDGFGGHGFGGPGFGGPRGFGGPQRRPKGAAREAILSLLAEQPRNGYGLIKAIAERTDGSWTPSPGSVYPTLQQLVDEGLIETTSDDKRSDFQLTDEGRTYVTEHTEQLARVWAGADEHTEANADLRDSIAKLMGVVHQFRFAATEAQRAQAVEQINDTRRNLYRILGE